MSINPNWQAYKIREWVKTQDLIKLLTNALKKYATHFIDALYNTTSFYGFMKTKAIIKARDKKRSK